MGVFTRSVLPPHLALLQGLPLTHCPLWGILASRNISTYIPSTMDWTQDIDDSWCYRAVSFSFEVLWNKQCLAVRFVKRSIVRMNICQFTYTPRPLRLTVIHLDTIQNRSFYSFSVETPSTPKILSEGLVGSRHSTMFLGYCGENMPMSILIQCVT